MKKILRNIMLPAMLTMAVACEDNSFDLDYKAPLSIAIEGVDNSNIVHVEKGVMSYTAKIGVQAEDYRLAYFEIYNADAVTGAKGSLIDGTSQSFLDEEGNGVNSFSVDYVISELIENKCIKILVTDIEGTVFERNLLVEITPSVLFSASVIMETVENYYGPYFATWLDGRVYMRREGQKYPGEIDISLGDVVIAEEGTDIVPALVNPAERASFNLLTINGLQQTRYELTSLTKGQYDAITQINAEVVVSLPDPTKSAVKLEANKVYLFKTADGKKGLVCASTVTAKTGTIENTSGKWVEDTPYYQVTLTAKTVVE